MLQTFKKMGQQASTLPLGYPLQIQLSKTKRTSKKVATNIWQGMRKWGINCILLLDSTECWMRPEAFVPISHKSQDKFYMQFSHAQSHTVCACTCGYLHWDCPFCIQLYKRNKTIKVDDHLKTYVAKSK